MKKASAVKNKLISIIAHDLIGSIRFMPIALGLIRDKSTPREDADALLVNVEQNAIASFETLQNMLDWGKTQIQGVVLDKANFSVTDVTTEVLQFIDIVAQNKQIRVENKIPAGLVVFADINHFKFVIRNLLSNAIKYTNKGGVIQINAKLSDDSSHIIFSVKDNGIGVSANKKAHIFEPYVTSSNGTDNETGNGIGLNLCREFVTENGGRIWMESEENKGSVFYFSLSAGKSIAGVG